MDVFWILRLEMIHHRGVSFTTPFAGCDTRKRRRGRSVLRVLALGAPFAVAAAACSGGREEGRTDWRPPTLAEYNAALPADVHPDSRSRVPLVDRAALDAEGQRAYDAYTSPATPSLAGLQGAGGIRLHLRVVGVEGGLDRRTQELARLVVSRELDQVFEWGMHEPVALEEGLDPAIIDVVRHARSLETVPAREASIIRLGREVFQAKRVGPETFAAVLGHLGMAGLIELCDRMGDYARTAILLNTVDVRLPYDRPPLLPLPGAPAGPDVEQPALTLEQYNAALPADVFPDSRSRIPLVRREDLDEEGRKGYDARMAADTTSLAGLQGPGGLGLQGSRDLAETGVSRKLQELARLVVAREMDQVFEWGMHEPVALEEGLDPAIIEIIRHDRPLDGLGQPEAAIVQWGREVFRQHRVTSATFAAARARLGTKDVIDLARLMGDYTRSAILLHTMDVHLPYDREPRLPVPR